MKTYLALRGRAVLLRVEGPDGVPFCRVKSKEDEGA